MICTGVPVADQPPPKRTVADSGAAGFFRQAPCQDYSVCQGQSELLGLLRAIEVYVELFQLRFMVCAFTSVFRSSQ